MFAVSNLLCSQSSGRHSPTRIDETASSVAAVRLSVFSSALNRSPDLIAHAVRIPITNVFEW